MKKEFKKDILSLIIHFQKTVLSKKPSAPIMYRDVKMMHFKIRPLHGDVSRMNLRDIKFVEILWSLGKLDEFFQVHAPVVGEGERGTFFKMMDDLYEDLQNQLNSLQLRKEPLRAKNYSVVEMEIFKENFQQKKPN